jgi:hypothetical protein
VLCTAIGALVGWPFAALLGLPLVIEMVAGGRRLATRFILYALASAVLVGVPLVVVGEQIFAFFYFSIFFYILSEFFCTLNIFY